MTKNLCARPRVFGANLAIRNLNHRNPHHLMCLNRVLVAVCVIAVFSAPAIAAPPAWWTDDNTRIVAPGVSPENYAPLNLGQLKHVASQAKKHLDLQLAAVGGAGPQINALVSGFTPNATQNPTQQAAAVEANYAPANLGQLKAVAKVFYQRLIAIGYNTRQNLIDHGAAGWAFDYPWNPATPVEGNYAPANLGQLKWVFSFSLTGFPTDNIDTNGNGLPDAWEVRAGRSPFTVNDPNADADVDGIPDSQEAMANTSPNDPAPTLTLTSPSGASLVP